MSSFKVGEHEIFYHPEEMDGLPHEMFFDFRQSVPFIHRENFLTREEIDYLYRGGQEAFPRKRFATVHDYADGAAVEKFDDSGRVTHLLPCKPDIYQFLEKKLTEAIYPMIADHYTSPGKPIIEGKFNRAEGWQMLGYGENHFFANHCDSCVYGGSDGSPDPSKTWWCNAGNRKFSIVLYLNAQSDHPTEYEYSGGSLIFNKVWKDGQVATINPKPGTIIIFPSNIFFVHEVLPVTAGYRFACVTWVDVVA